MFNGVDRPVSGWVVLGVVLAAIGGIGALSYVIYFVMTSPIPTIK